MCVHMLMEVCAWHFKQFLAKCRFVVHCSLYLLKLEVSLAVYFVFFMCLFLPSFSSFVFKMHCVQTSSHRVKGSQCADCGPAPREVSKEPMGTQS